MAIDCLKNAASYPVIQDVLHLTYVENRGAAFGMLKDERWLFMAISTFAIVIMFIYLIVFRKRLSPLLGASLALIIGGGIGNMIDRVAYGFVVDYIDFTIINFWVFNFADMCVCIGAALLLISVLFAEIDENKAAKKRLEAKERAMSAKEEESDDYTPMFIVIDDPEEIDSNPKADGEAESDADGNIDK